MSTGAPPTAEPENAWAGQGSVLLDIGGDVGALVVAMPRSMVGVEVEIEAHDRAGKPVHDHGHGHDHGHPHRAHVAVVDRRTPDGSAPTLVFGDLVEGRYDLFLKGTDEVRLTAQVQGGRVTEVTWPA